MVCAGNVHASENETIGAIWRARKTFKICEVAASAKNYIL